MRKSLSLDIIILDDILYINFKLLLWNRVLQELAIYVVFVRELEEWPTLHVRGGGGGGGHFMTMLIYMEFQNFDVYRSEFSCIYVLYRPEYGLFTKLNYESCYGAKSRYIDDSKKKLFKFRPLVP